MNFRFLCVKILRAMVTVLIVLSFVFIVLRVSGDPVENLVGDEADPEIVEYYRAKYGLDEPLHEQYFRYFQGVFSGDLGFSFKDERDAVEVVAERIPRTLQLGLASFAFGIFLGVPLGILAALTEIRRLTASRWDSPSLATASPTSSSE